MKIKHQGLITLGLVVMSLAAAVINTRTDFWRSDHGVPVPAVKRHSDHKVPDPREIRKIRKLGKKISQLILPVHSDATEVNLALFGYQPVRDSGMDEVPADTDEPDHAEYTLTFTFSSGDKRYCIIDGAFNSEGTVLPDGATITKIEPKRVLITRENTRQWVDLVEATKFERTNKG